MNLRLILLSIVLSVLTVVGCSNHNAEVDAANARAQVAEAETARVKAEVDQKKKEGADDVLLVLGASNDSKYVGKQTSYYGVIKVITQESGGPCRVMFWHDTTSLLPPSVTAFFSSGHDLLNVKEGDTIRFIGTEDLPLGEPLNGTHVMVFVRNCTLI